MRKIGLAVIIIIIFLASAAAIKTIKSKIETPNQPVQAISYTGWKNYENKNFRYGIQYSYDWFEITEGLNPPAPTTAKFASVAPDNIKAPHVFVEVTVIAKKGRTMDSLEEIQELLAKGHVARKMTISGSPAILIDRLGEGGDAANIYVDHKDNIFRLKWDGTQNDVRRQFREKSLQTIASFRFLD